MFKRLCLKLKLLEQMKKVPGWSWLFWKKKLSCKSWILYLSLSTLPHMWANHECLWKTTEDAVDWWWVFEPEKCKRSLAISSSIWGVSRFTMMDSIILQFYGNIIQLFDMIKQMLKGCKEESTRCKQNVKQNHCKHHNFKW